MARIVGIQYQREQPNLIKQFRVDMEIQKLMAPLKKLYSWKVIYTFTSTFPRWYNESRFDKKSLSLICNLLSDFLISHICIHDKNHLIQLFENSYN